MMKFSRWFALIGLAQGLILWWLWSTHGLTPMWRMGMFYGVLAGPLVIYFTQDVPTVGRNLRLWAALVYTLAYGLLGAYSQWASGEEKFSVMPSEALAAIVLAFISLGLLCGFDVTNRRFDYAKLFQNTWRNGILTLMSAAMTGALWTVLFAGGQVMALIGLTWVMALINEPMFVWSITCLVISVAFALGLSRAGMTDVLRRFWLSISQWLLILVLFFGALWVLALPWTGLQRLFETRSASLMLLWLVALAIKFANCAYQDGEQKWPYPKAFNWLTQLAWLSLLAITAVACWALGLRVHQHGWSSDRLWAALVAAMACIYVLGYSFSWLQRTRWMATMARTNVLAAGLLCLALMALLSPVAQIQRLGVSMHLQHMRQQGADKSPDWHYLRWQSGRFGLQALTAMATGQDKAASAQWATQARQKLAQKNRYETTENMMQGMTQDNILSAFKVWPEKRTLPITFLKWLQQAQDVPGFITVCFNRPPCSLWIGDLNGDGQEELVLFGISEQSMRTRAFILGFESGVWKNMGYVKFPPFDGHFPKEKESL
jgi:Domain of unknown function (DUF4153)